MKDTRATLDAARAMLAALPDDGGPLPSFDALFIAAALASRTRTRTPPKAQADAPPWLSDALEALQGQRLTVGEFAFKAGHPATTKAELNRIGRALRETGRSARKVGGRTVYAI